MATLKYKKTILEITEKIRKRYNPDKIILFGSYAYGKPGNDSDIDLFIIKNTRKRRIDRFVEVKRIAYDPERNIPFSPLVYTSKEIKERLALGDDFVAEILERGKVLYARQE